jgi:hypothetical protein
MPLLLRKLNNKFKVIQPHELGKKHSKKNSKKKSKEETNEFEGGSLISTYIHPIQKTPYESDLKYRLNHPPPISIGKNGTKFGAGNLDFSTNPNIKNTKDMRIKFII